MDELSEARRARLTVESESADGALLIGLGGELDIAGLPDVAHELEAVLARAPQPVQLDLTDLRFLDSSGVTVLIRIANHFEPVTARGATPAVRRVIQVLGLTGRFGLDGA
jgi:anti-sigma B factor antagonist